jgi:hypothetical protein
MASRFSELRALEKEEERKAKENMRLSKQDTERLLGKNWREREAAKRATPQYRASKAQEALEERAAVNRSLLPPSAYAPLPKEGETEVDLPGGGKATFGAETLRNIRAAREVPEQQKAEGRRKVGESINRMYAEAYERNKQRYEQELADRGLRSPLQAKSPEERRRIEEENSREMMADFRTAISARERAARAENQLARDYRDYRKSALEARRAGDAQSAVEYERRASNINEMVGGNISNVTARRRVLEEGARSAVQRELQARANLRREINAKRTTANPEGGMFEMTQPATRNVWTQPFDLTAPAPTGATAETAPITEPTYAPTTTPTPTPATPEVPEIKPQGIVEELESVGEPKRPPSKPSRPKASPRTESAIKARTENERKAVLAEEKSKIERSLYEFDRRGKRGRMKPKFDPESEVVKKALARLKQIESEL